MTIEAKGGLKWTYYDPDVLPAWVAEMCYPIAPPIAEALHRAVDNSLTGYFFPEAEHAAFAAATSFWAEQLDWVIDQSWLYSAPDVIEGTRRSIELLTRPGSQVVLHTPVYFPFFGMVERAGRELVEIPSPRDADGRYRLDLDGISKAFERGAGSVVLCNPWNPTGQVFEHQELADLIEIARSNDARVISDEIHAPLTYPGAEHIPASTIDPVTVVTVTSASKTFDLPGLKSAQVVLTNEADRQKWSDYFTADKVGVGTFGLIATAAAYGESTDWYLETMETLNSNRKTLLDMLATDLPRVTPATVEATYLAWLDFSDYDLDDPHDFLLENARIALTTGAPFGADSSQFARLNFATTNDILVEIVERMKKALDQL